MKRKSRAIRPVLKRITLFCVSVLIIVFSVNAFIIFYDSRHEDTIIISHVCDGPTQCNCPDEKECVETKGEQSALSQKTDQNGTESSESQAVPTPASSSNKQSTDTTATISTTTEQTNTSSVSQQVLKAHDPYLDGIVAGLTDIYFLDEHGKSSTLQRYWRLEGTKYAYIYVDHVNNEYVWKSKYLELSNNSFVTTENDHWSSGKDSYMSVNLPKEFNFDYDYMAKKYGMRIRRSYAKDTGQPINRLVFTFGGRDYVFNNVAWHELNVVKPECRWDNRPFSLDSNTTYEYEGKVTPWFAVIDTSKWSVKNSDDLKIISSSKDDNGVIRIKLETGNIKKGANNAWIYHCSDPWSVSFTGKGYKKEINNNN